MSFGPPTASTDNKSIREINETLKDLSREIKESNEKSQTLNNSILALTFIATIVAILEFIKLINPHPMTIFTEYLITFGWAITGAISMALALALGLKIYSALTPVNEWKEIEKGNMAAAIVVASVILGFALVIALTIN